MVITAEILSSILMDLVPEAENAYVALEDYLDTLYKRIRIKDISVIDYESDLQLFLMLSAFKTEIAQLVHKEYNNEKFKR